MSDVKLRQYSLDRTLPDFCLKVLEATVEYNKCVKKDVISYSDIVKRDLWGNMHALN